MSSTNAIAVINELESVICVFGEPRRIVTDNGTPFDSQAFSEFCTSRDIILSHSPAYHPESNGMAERSVHIVQKSLQKIMLSDISISLSKAITQFLFTYRNTPTTPTGKTPNDLLLCFKPRTNVSRLNPRSHVAPNTISSFKEGDKVFIKLSKKHPVVSGEVVRHLGGSV